MKRICAFFLACLLICNIPALSVSATSLSDEIVDTTSAEKCVALTDELNLSRNLDLEISTVKELLDFDGNTYYAIEFDPIGYAIMHGSTGELIEFSKSAISPYFDHDQNLFYCGPTYYYYWTGTEYQHVWYNETLSDEVMDAAVTESSNLNAEMLSLASSTAQTFAPQVTSNAPIYVGGTDFLAELTSKADMGYWAYDNGDDNDENDGVCGFIAAGLLLLSYIDQYPKVIDNFSYLYDENHRFIDEDFTRKLFTYRDGSNLSAAEKILTYSSIKNVLTSYCDAINVSITCSTDTLPIASRLLSILKTGRPVIIFGSLTSPTGSTFSHAVLAYGYTADGTIIVHFGHSGYSEVELEYVALGSSLYINSLSVNDMTFSDVATTSWSYDAVSYCTRYGIIDEYSGTTFQPSSGMTRGMFVNALYHLCGEPEVTTDDINDAKAQFTDYSTSTKYYKALAWAYREDLIKGIDTEGVTIAASTTITREQAVTFLYRFDDMIFYDYDDTSGPSVYDFDDYDDLHTYALTAMDWATERYIINGTGDNLLNPRSTMTKAQCAAMIYKFTNVAIYPGY